MSSKTTKKCTKCLETLDLIHFDTHFHNKRGKSYYRACCKKCRKQILNEYKKNKVLTDKKRKCSNCKKIKTENDFYPIGTKCKQCMIQMNSLNYHQNKNTITYTFIICRYCNREKHSKYFRFNRRRCIECEKKYTRDYNIVNSHIRKKWITANKEHVVKQSLKRRSIKTASLKAIVSLDNMNTNILKKWLQFNFDEDINWENHGTVWHIDHTLPISKFKGDDLCFINDWSNLMPLKKHLNLRKSARICPFYIFHLERRLREFGFENKILVESKIIDLNYCFTKVKNNL